MEVNNGIKLNGIAVRNVTGGNYVCDDNPLPVKVIGGGISEGGGSGGGSDISLPTDDNGNVLMNLNAIGTSQSLGVNVTGVDSGVTLGVSLDNVTTTTSVPVSIKNTSIPVSGSVGITGTPSVIIKSAESAVPISGNVGISGTPDVNITNSSLNVNVANTSAIKTSISNTPNVNLSSVGSGVKVPVEWSGTPSFTLGGIGSGINTSNPIPTLDTGGYTLDIQNATFISGSGYNKDWNSPTTGFSPLFTATNQRVRLLGVASEANQIFAFQKPNVFTIYFPCNLVIDLIGLQNGSFNGSADQGFCSVVNSNTVGILLMYWVYS